MANQQASIALGQLRKLFAAQRDSQLPDEQLVQRFVADRDEAAFAALVRRHGPMALGVCQAVLNHTQDAEDACQAAFLVLARKAGSIRKKTSVASWLHGVAYRLARKLAASKDRMPPGQASDRSSPSTMDDVSWREVRQILHEELERLPEKYRQPLILCYLECQTQEEAARQLGWSAGMLKGMLTRGRDVLRRRLTQRGLDSSVPLFAVSMAFDKSAAPLANAMARSAVLYLSGQMIGAGLSAEAVVLAQHGVKAMLMTKLKVAAALILVAGALVGGMGVAAYPIGEGDESLTPRNDAKNLAAVVRIKQASGKDKEQPRIDLHGVSLPEGAVARLGTLKFRLDAKVRGRGLFFLPDGKTLAVSTADGIIFWDLATGSEVRRVRGFDSAAIDFSPDGKSIALNHGEITLVEFTTGKPLFKVDQQTPSLNAFSGQIRFSPNGKIIAACYLGSDGNDEEEPVLLLLDAVHGKILNRIKIDDRFVFGLAFSPDGKTLAAHGFSDIYFFNVANGKLLQRIPAPLDGAVSPIAYSPDGRNLARGNKQGVELIEMATGKVRAKFAMKSGMVYSVAFTKDGRYLMAAADTAKACVWEVLTGKLQLEADCQMEHGAGAALSVDDATLAMAAHGSSVVRLWDIASGKEKVELQGHDGPINAVAFAPDGKKVATGGGNQHVHLWDAAMGQHLLRFKGVNADNLAFSPDGKRLAGVGRERIKTTGEVPPSLGLIWDAVSGEVLLPLPVEPSEELASLAYFNDGKRLITGVFNIGKGATGKPFGTGLQLWDANSGKRLEQFNLEYLNPRTLAIAPNGMMVAVGGSSVRQPDKDERFLRLVDLKAGGKTLKLLGHQREVWSVAFSPDDKLLASGSDDQTVRLWDPATGKELAKLVGHERCVAAVAFSPDGRVLASADGAGSFYGDLGSTIPKPGQGSVHRIRLWDVATGKEMASLQGHKVNVTSLAFSPDGSRVVSGLGDGTALIWDVKKSTAGR